MTKMKPSRNRCISVAIGLGLYLLGSGGCQGSTDGMADQSASMRDTNGLSSNGLSSNGLSTNGLSSNGLSSNGLSSTGFNDWFDSNPISVSDMIMKYIVRCAVPAGEIRSYISVAGLSHTWEGELGLAPGWASGEPATSEEEQIVSACLAAHVNRFGVSVPISVIGFDARGGQIPMGETELTDFPISEGCFFGNLFRGEGIYVGSDSVFPAGYSSSRDCAIADPETRQNNSCPPMIFVGACSEHCVMDSSLFAYRSCSYNGKDYAAIGTRISPDIMYRCGDQVCQVSEHCGTGNTPNNCSDCGPCQ